MTYKYYDDLSSWIIGVEIDEGLDELPIEIIKTFGNYTNKNDSWFNSIFDSFIRTRHIEYVDDDKKELRRLPSKDWIIDSLFIGKK